jgi:outer membrane autotransporter protein
VTRTVTDIVNDAILTRFGLLASAARADGAPNFGIFASGQLAGVSHDGFEVSGGGISGVTPGFDATDFSVAASLELDAAQYFGFDDRYGLDVGVYGGYASTAVDMDPTSLFTEVGDAENHSGMFGSYALFRSGTTYGLVSATGFLGRTDITNDVLNSTGDYDTAGYALTATAGHVFALNENWRFDLRGGLLGASFRGDEFTDSVGNEFGDSRISFGAVKFEPGFFAQYVLENNKIFSPYLRAELQQRFDYKNTSSLDGVDFAFDDSDFSTSVSAGANYKFAEKWTASGEVRGKFSSDSQTLGGKLGVKVRF